MASHLRYFLVFSWILLIVLNPGPVVGLKCYECTSEDPGCDTNVKETGTKYVKECDRNAIGCINWFIQYEFVFPPLLTRSCAFGYFDFSGGPEEQKCLLGEKNYWSRIDQNVDSDISDNPKSYTEVIECIKSNRVTKGLPPPSPVAKHAPVELGMVVYTAKTTELSNTNDLNGGKDQWDISVLTRKYKAFAKTHPNDSELHCYSCDEDVPTEGFGSVRVWQAGQRDKISTPMPQCAETKRILCKKSYGCATIWEVRKEPGGLSSRIWRGCWHPGDQLCLRRPVSKHGDASVPYSALGRNNGVVSKKNGDFDKNCGQAYVQSRTTDRDSTVQWAGTIVKETEALYNEYIQCRQDVRQRLGLEQLKNVSRKVLNVTDKPEGEDFFAAFRYIFCGFTEGWNLRENEDDPWKPPPKPTTPPGPVGPGPETGLGNCAVKKNKSNAGSTHTSCFFLAMISLCLLIHL